jgi:alpha-tubulin suppressor-like RCC1 family protein
MSHRLVVVTITLAAALLAPPGASAADQPATGGQAEAGTADWRSVSAGNTETCGIRTSGRLYCWGDDSFGQLGNGILIAGDVMTPDEVAGGHTDWTSVSVGNGFACGRRSTGRIYCWGYDGDGQLGNGAPVANRTAPTEVAGGRTDWVDVQVGRIHACARRASGRLFCWGASGGGQVGHSATPNSTYPVPVEVAGGRTDWRAFGLAQETTCALRASGRLFCWGNDFEGQLGNNASLANQHLPVQVAGGHTDWTAVRGGANHNCARRAGGDAFCWGDDAMGQVGTSSANDPEPRPVEIADGNFTGWGVPDGGDNHSCALRSGHLYCFGGDYSGQLGVGPGLDTSQTPLEVSGGLSTWTKVSVGSNYTCAIRVSQRLYCWGSNGHGKTGLATSTGNQEIPAEVSA